MGAITNLWRSERGILAVLLVISATVLASLNRMSIDAWRDFSLYVFGIYATTRTVTGAVDLVVTAKRDSAAASANLSTSSTELPK